MMPVHVIEPIQLVLAILGLLLSVAWVIFWIVVTIRRWNKPPSESIEFGKVGFILMLVLGAGILTGSIWLLVSVIN